MVDGLRRRLASECAGGQVLAPALGSRWRVQGSQPQFPTIGGRNSNISRRVEGLPLADPAQMARQCSGTGLASDDGGTRSMAGGGKRRQRGPSPLVVAHGGCHGQPRHAPAVASMPDWYPLLAAAVVQQALADALDPSLPANMRADARRFLWRRRLQVLGQDRRGPLVVLMAGPIRRYGPGPWSMGLGRHAEVTTSSRTRARMRRSEARMKPGVGSRRFNVIPERLKRYVAKVAAQPRDQVERRAKRLRILSWVWLALLLLVGGNYFVEVWSGKGFTWTEAVAHTLPFLTMALIAGVTRDTMLLVLFITEKKNSQPTSPGDVATRAAPEK